MMEKVDIAIIGAGVVGLAIAYELSKKTNSTIVVVEKNASFGLETSSRNSQVIHSGIYYPSTMLKTQLCVEGRQKLYKFCEKYKVGHKRLGKLIVASDAEDLDHLYHLLEQADANQVEAGLLSAAEVHELEPTLQVSEALFVPESGLIDVHELMHKLHVLSCENGVIFVFNSELINLEWTGQEYILETNRDKFRADWLINSAGLNSSSIPSLLGMDIDKNKYRIFPCKGEYYSLKHFEINHLVYPIPGKSGLLGIHITPDLHGSLRLGPNAYDVGKINYNMDETYKGVFHQSVQRFLPDLNLEDISPDFAGIRPRRQKISDPLQDFIITEESANGYPHLINLIGIESPGLTSCLAIGNYVQDILSSKNS